MLSTEEIQFNNAKRQYEKAQKRMEKAFEWYKGASDDGKKRILLSDIEIMRMYFEVAPYNLPERDYIYDGNSQELNLSNEQAYTDVQGIPNIMALYHEGKVALEELRRCDNVLKEKNEIHELEGFLDEVATGNIIRTEHYDTSILDNYRNWGIERICLDGFQNHLPADSKGTRCFLQFLVDDRWVDYEEAVLQKDKIAKVRFADDGVGFSNKNLKFLSSQKSSEDLSAGQFGEGLKLIAMASVNLGLGIEIQSQNWMARAFGQPETITNYRSGRAVEEKHNQLAWDVSVFDGNPIKRFKNYI